MTEVLVGFEGKLPSRGDFISRGLPRSFLSPWRSWVDASLAASRRTLGEGWELAWLEAPVWRFTLPGGACGPDAVLGLTLPSVDRVGRHYPLTVAAVFIGQAALPSATDWLDVTEPLAMSALAEDWEPGALMAAISSLTPPAAGGTATAATWWTAGSPRVAAETRTLLGLPEPEAFAAMIGHTPELGAFGAPASPDSGDTRSRWPSPRDSSVP